MAGFGVSRERVFGLDIGYETLKLCELVKRRKSAKIVGIFEYPITKKILEQDRIKDKEAIANMIKEARRKAKPHQIKSPGIVTALPENFVFSKTIQVPKMTVKELMTAIPNEAAQYLPVPLESVYVDFQILTDHPEENLMDVLIAATPKKLVDDYVEMARLAGFKLLALETKPIAVGRAIIPDKSREGIVIVHIGTELTRISIWDKGKIRLITTAEVGKNKIIETISTLSGKIEKIDKINVESDDKNQLKITFQPMIDEILESVRYYQNRGYKPSKISKILICGSGGLVKGVDKLIGDELKIKSEIATTKIKTSIPIESNYMTAFGLALREI